MENVDEHIDILINACKTAIEQMTQIKVKNVEKRLILKGSAKLPFAHIITYTDNEKKMDGEFNLGFESVKDALKLASAIAERLGLGKFDKISEDSTDLLNEFLNIVVGRTISEWDSTGLSVSFAPPVFKENYLGRQSEDMKAFLLTMDVTHQDDKSKKAREEDQILFRVSFVEQVEKKFENKTILVVDDSRVMRNIITKTLKENGAEIREAQDGVEAVKMHKMYNPDLTLMDINMPKLNGIDAIAQIKQDQPNAKFIILSSSSRKDEILSAKKLKVAGYLVKPADPDKLIERVASAI